MTNCDPSKARSQNGQSSFLWGTKQPIKPDKKSRIHRPNFSSSSRFLASAESDFPDWFLVFSRLICWAFSPGEGLEVGQGKCQSHRELTLWWKGQNLKIVYSTSLYHHTSHANASSNCLLLHLLLFSVFHKLTDLIIFRPFEIALRRTWKILKLWNCKHLGWVISCLHH